MEGFGNKEVLHFSPAGLVSPFASTTPFESLSGALQPIAFSVHVNDVVLSFTCILPLRLDPNRLKKFEVKKKKNFKNKINFLKRNNYI